MKNNIGAFTGIFGIAVLTALPAYSQVVAVNNNTVGSSTAFPTFSISGANGSLAFSSVGASPAGATIAGGAAQGTPGAGNSFGETFDWTGATANLGAISIIATGDGGLDSYTLQLFNLGAGPFNAPSTQFNPSLQTDLLTAGDTATLPALGSKNFVEFDFSGGDQVALQTGDNYAFVLTPTGSPTLTFERASGAQSDPNGDSFIYAIGATSDNAAPYSSGVRNDFIGVYTVAPVPEPTSMALLGLGALVGTFVVRRQKK